MIYKSRMHFLNLKLPTIFTDKPFVDKMNPLVNDVKFSGDINVDINLLVWVKLGHITNFTFLCHLEVPIKVFCGGGGENQFHLSPFG